MNLRLFLKIASPFFLFANILEVSLPTQRSLTPLYVTEVHTASADQDKAYFETLRQIFLYDLNTSGFAKAISKKKHLEEKVYFSEPRIDSDRTVWKQEKIPYVLSFQVVEKQMILNVFNVEKGTSKEYSSLPISGALHQDRREVHRLSGSIQNDLFGFSGISMLKLIYAKRHKKGNEWVSDLWMCDADGENDHPIHSNHGYCVSPFFFPDQKKYLYVSYTDGQSKIYQAQLGSGEAHLLISLRGSQVLPALSKRGDQIAFITDSTGSPDLFTQDLQGEVPVGRPRQLSTAPKTTHASPTYSPDGKSIAFVSDKEGSPRIYVMDMKTRDPRKITQKHRENTSPSWSPDGKKIAYSAKVDGVRQIWIYTFATDTEEALTKGAENKENPSWASDSLHLVYNTESSETCELYQIHIHHRCPVKISKGNHQKRFASWVY